MDFDSGWIEWDCIGFGLLDYGFRIELDLILRLFGIGSLMRISVVGSELRCYRASCAQSTFHSKGGQKAAGNAHQCQKV